jgi:tetratricopeptide (TPR) repeat protein
MSKLPEIDRKTLKRPDEFVRGGRSVIDFLVKQKKRFVPVLIVAGVSILAVYAYDAWNARKETAAWDAYVVAGKLPDAEKWEKLKSVHAEHGKSRAGFFAALDLADHNFDLAKKSLSATPPVSNPPEVTEARTWYTKALEYSDLLPKEKQLLVINRGNTSELAEKWDEALADYQQAEGIAAEGKPLAQLATGRVLEKKNDTAKAIEVYEKISVESQATEFGKVAKNSVRRLKSPLLQPTAKGKSE